MEIEISDSAISKIIEISKEYKIEPTVRIYVEKAGCNGASYGIGFDEPKQYDVLTEIDGIDIVTDTEFMTKYTDGLSVDYAVGDKSGFIIKSVKAPVKIIENDNISDGATDNEYETLDEKSHHKGIGCCGAGGSCGSGEGGCGCSSGGGSNKGH